MDHIMQDPNDKETENALHRAYEKTQNQLAKVKNAFKSMLSELHLEDHENNTTRSERSSADTCIIS